MNSVLLLWIFASLCFLFAVSRLIQVAFSALPKLGEASEAQKVLQVARFLQNTEESLKAGIVPDESFWRKVQSLSTPWSTVLESLIKALRNQGSELLPGLSRLRKLAQTHYVSLGQARSKSSQAFAQSLITFLLIPIFAGLLYWMVPALQQEHLLWGSCCLLTLGLNGVAGLWIYSLVENARWGGVSRTHRSWLILSQCAGEYFLSRLRSGMPADLTWVETVDLVRNDSPSLASAWGSHFFETSPLISLSNQSTLEKKIMNHGQQIKSAVQTSLIEGRPCGPHVESTLKALQSEIECHIEEQVQLLSTKALKPLFLCVAPSVLFLIFAAVWIVASHSLPEGIQLESIHAF